MSAQAEIMATHSSILPVVEADLAVLSGFLYWSKLALAINRVLVKDWPNEERQKKNYADALYGSFLDPSNECIKAVDEETGEIVGFVVLTRQHAPPESEAKTKEGDKLPTAPDWMGMAVFEAVMGGSAYVMEATDKLECFGMTDVRDWQRI